MTVAAASPVASQPGRDTLPRILAAGLAGGAVDFFYASGLALSNGQALWRPWQSVASGWLGPAAREAGVGGIVLGLATHFGIALMMAAAYVLVARRIPVVVGRPLATGAVYGLILYGVMYLGVLPLRWPEVFPNWNGVKSALDVLAHVGVGLAIAWAASRSGTAINPKPTSARAG
jgi:hypothetical protein